MTVDEILARGHYTDRRGRVWQLDATGNWWHFPSDHRLEGPQMRLLIERDMHRDECVGLDLCTDHPAWIVSMEFNEDGYRGWEIVRPHSVNGRLRDVTHSDAMDVAYGLAVSSD